MHRIEAGEKSADAAVSRPFAEQPVELAQPLQGIVDGIVNLLQLRHARDRGPKAKDAVLIAFVGAGSHNSSVRYYGLGI